MYTMLIHSPTNDKNRYALSTLTFIYDNIKQLKCMIHYQQPNVRHNANVRKLISTIKLKKNYKKPAYAMYMAV